MKAISKILAVALLATSASSASAFVEHDDGVTYEDIRSCLADKLGLEEGKHFRKKKGPEGTIQLNHARVAGDSFDLADVAACWKKQTSSKQDK